MFKIFSLLLIVFISSGASWAYTAVSDGYFQNGRHVRIKPAEVKRQGIYNEGQSSAAVGEFELKGIYISRDSRNSLHDKKNMSFFKAGRDSFVTSTDPFVVVSEKVSLPKEPGRYSFVHSAGFRGGIESKCEWEYRVFPDGYSRLSGRVNGGTSKGYYDGDRIPSAELVSVFPIEYIAPYASESISLRSSSEELDVPFYVLPSGASDDDGGVLMKASFRGKKEFPFLWRCSVYVKREGKNIIEYTDCGRAEKQRKFSWDGITSLGFKAEPGRHFLSTEVFADTPDGLIELQAHEREIFLEEYPRFFIKDKSGEIIADSRFDGISASDFKHRFPLMSGYEFMKSPAALGYACNRIYMRKGNGELHLYLSCPGEKFSGEAVVSSDIRRPVYVEMKESAPSVYKGIMPVTESPVSKKGCLAVGPSLDGAKSYAFLDITYPEDSDAFAAVLKSKGWQARGEIFPDDFEMPHKELFLNDFIRSGGFERLSCSCGKFSASFMMKNQSSLFYYSGHGWGDGSIFHGKAFFFPERDMKEGDWNDGMEAAIFSSCSVLDIMNFKNRKFTELGHVNYSPGKYWEKMSGGRPALLGYNWSTFEGKPPNAFDTRVIRAFLSEYFSGKPYVSGWFNANFSNNESECPCAIYKGTYYYVMGGRVCEYPGEKWQIKGPIE